MLRVPPELTYKGISDDNEFTDVVVDRNEMRLTYPINELHSNERFSVVLNSSNFVDLRSIKMYGVLKVLENNAEVASWNSPFLFESITLKTEQGVVLEHLDQAHLVSTLARKLSRKKDDEETVLGNSLLASYNTNFLDGTTLEIPSFNLLGFFNLRKVLRLSSLGALIIDFKLSNANELYQSVNRLRALGNSYHKDYSNVTFTLNDMFILYDEVEVSEAYLSKYISDYERGKMTLTMNTIKHSRDVINGLSGEKTIRIHRSANKVKSILTTITPYLSHRKKGDNNFYGCNTYVPPFNLDNMFYQYKLNGQTYPSLGVRSTTQAFKHYQDCFYLNYGRKQVNDLTYANFSSPALPYFSVTFLKNPNTTATNTDDDFLVNGTDVTSKIEARQFVDAVPSSRLSTVTFTMGTAPDESLNSELWYIKLSDSNNLSTNGFGDYLSDVYTQMTVNGLNCIVRRTAVNNIPYMVCIFERSITFIDLVGGSVQRSLTVPGTGANAANVTTLSAPNTFYVPQLTEIKFYPRSMDAGSYMMCYSLNSVLNPMSRNYGSVDASNAQLSFNFGTPQKAAGNTYATKLNEKRFNVDTYMFHEQTIHVREGEVSVSN